MNIFIENKKYRFYAKIVKSENVAKISYLGVAPRFRNQGVAKQVILDFIKECTSCGVNKIVIDAHKKSLMFWQKLGFEISCEPQIYNGKVQDYHDGNFIIKYKKEKR